MMSKKDMLLEQIRRKSQREAARLAGEFARAASEEKEELLAALLIEKWLAETCADCLDSSGPLS